MPGANDVLGCPRIFFKELPTQILSIRLAIFQTTFFSHIPNFSLFRVSFQISRKFAPCMSPVLHHVPITTLLSSFFSHLPTFLSKTGPLDVRGRRTVRIPSARYCK